MRYCTRCAREYGEEVERCVECPDGQLVGRAEAIRLGLVVEVFPSPLACGPPPNDRRKFVRVGTADDPLTTEVIGRALQSCGIAVFALDPRGGPVDVMTTGVTHDWWELRVPEDELARAAQIFATEKARLEATADEAARAAEEEELESEQPRAGLEPGVRA